jgi:hypothetical protein
MSSYQISNHSAETALTNTTRGKACTLSLHINNAVPEKSKVYINPSIASNIKSFSRDSSLKQTTLFPRSQKFTSIRQSLPISNQKNVNPSIASNIKSISRNSCLKQRCSRKVKSLHQSVNRFQYQIIQPRQLFETTLFPRSQKFTSIRQSLPISNHSAETVL